MSYILQHYKEFDKPLTNINYQIPEIQRPDIEEHSDEIYLFEKSYYEQHNRYCIHGNISVAINDKTKIQYLIDGQHRITAYKRLQNDFPDRPILISVDYYLFNDASNIDMIYKLVNTNKKNDITELSVDYYKIINETMKYLTNNFKEYVKNTQSPHKPCFNQEIIKNALIESNIVKKLEIINSKQLIDMIIDLNKFYSTVPLASFKKWGVKSVSDIIERMTNKSNKFYLGLYRTEWINILLYHSPDEYKNIDHPAEGHRMPISHVMRKKVWNSDMVDGKCYCCNEPITFTNFECGHIKAVSLGGKNTIDNMKPICRQCNADMGVTNLEEYKASLLGDT